MRSNTFMIRHYNVIVIDWWYFLFLSVIIVNDADV
jgi:hypothetical protein